MGAIIKSLYKITIKGGKLLLYILKYTVLETEIYQWKIYYK